MREFMIVMILISVLLPTTVALTDEQKKIQDSFDDGFVIGQFYTAGKYNTTQAKEYNARAQEHNDYLNETYGDEAKDYLISFLPITRGGENETKDKIKEILKGQGVRSQEEQRPTEFDANLFVPDINAIKEIQINKVIRPLDNGIRIGQLSG